MLFTLLKNAGIALLLTLSLQGCLTAGMLPASVDGQALPSLSPMLEKVTPAVVNIRTQGKQKLDEALTQDPFFRRFLGELNEPMIDGTGSGVIVHAQRGHILTNYHVLEGAERIMVTLNDGREFDASIVGADPKIDLAIIKIEADRLKAIRFGNSDQLRVGDFVVAIGNPYGIGQSVTSGIISALHRNPGIGEYENFIQTDASINLGNSGGALINLRGELIGINTAILGGQSGGNIGIGFAIPINTAAGIVDQITRYGEVERGMLGVEIIDVEPHLATKANLPAKTGALIKRVFRDSAAQWAGLKEGDIILRINQSVIQGASDVKGLLGSMRVGTGVEIIYIRAGTTYRTEAKIGPSQAIREQNQRPFWEDN